MPNTQTPARETPAPDPPYVEPDPFADDPVSVVQEAQIETSQQTAIEAEAPETPNDGQEIVPDAPQRPNTPLADLVLEIEREKEGKIRRMPDKFRRFLIQVQGNKLYLPCQYRIVWMRDEEPLWSLDTHIVEGGYIDGWVTIRATVTDENGTQVASAHKSCTHKSFAAGFIEKAETGAVARCLSLAGFGTQFLPEIDEQADPNGEPYYSDAPAPNPRPARQPARNGTAAPAPRPAADQPLPKGTIWHGEGMCPKCHAPDGKAHGRPCTAPTSRK